MGRAFSEEAEALRRRRISSALRKLYAEGKRKPITPGGWNKGKKYTEDQRSRMRGGWHYLSAEGRERASRKWFGKRPPWNKGLKMPEEFCQRVSEATRKAAVEGRCKPPRPSRLEQKLQLMLDKFFPSQWLYVGDGKITIEGYIPDFLNCNGKKLIIEAYGRYWHRAEEEAERQKTFAKFGFATLILWEDEIWHHPRLTIRKIEEFLSGILQPKLL